MHTCVVCVVCVQVLIKSLQDCMASIEDEYNSRWGREGEGRRRGGEGRGKGRGGGGERGGRGRGGEGRGGRRRERDEIRT